MNTDLQITLFSHLPPPYVVPSTIEHELEWFFERGEKDTREAKPWDPARRWSTLAYRVVGGWLSGIDSYDAGILRVAYATEPRPQNLQRRLGRVTTVVVRLASLEAPWPVDPAEQKAHERRTASRLAWEYTLHGPRAVRPYVEPAVDLLRTAVHAYAEHRGRGPSMASQISTLPEFRQKPVT